MAFALNSTLMTSTPHRAKTDRAKTDRAKTDRDDSVRPVLSREELNRLFEEQAVPLMPDLYRTALAKMQYKPADAEDLLQEVYIKAFRAFHQFEQGTNLRAWLQTILHNTANNMFSKSNRDVAQRGLDDMEDWQVGDAESLTAMPSQSAEAEAIRTMPADVVKDALASLPDNFRDVVYYAIIGDYSYAQIAQMLGVKQATVGTRLLRGKKLLRKYLEDYARQEGYLTNTANSNGAEDAADDSNSGGNR